mmetsp:Transcript_12487/g.37131  ORF Transcript_12487/g.37131 Transcript_12487/m.37131 type:complete len:215 (+) Transcript_12487:50-694(+)
MPPKARGKAPVKKKKGGKGRKKGKGPKKVWQVKKFLTHGGNVIVARKSGGEVQVQFVRRSWKFGANWGPGKWNIVGGGKEKDETGTKETGTEAARREFREETGHDIDDYEWDELADGWLLVQLDDDADFVLSLDASHVREHHIIKDRRGRRVKVDTVWQPLQEFVDACTLTPAYLFHDKYSKVKSATATADPGVWPPSKAGILEHYEKIFDIMA